MSKNVFILGAGASAGCGVPLLKDFLRVANNIRTGGQLSQTDRALFDLVFRARDALTSINSKARLDFDNFEEIYSAFDMASLIGRLGNLDRASVSTLPMAMRRLITITIERSMRLPVSGNFESPKLLPPIPYDPFIKGIIDSIKRREVALLTFNYDLALDYTLYFNRIAFNYGLDGSSDDSNSLDLLKLHGSLNWGRCSDRSCRRIDVWRLEEFFKKFNLLDLYEAESVWLELASKLSSRTHCHPETLEADPVLIPPTWNKGGFHHELSHVWGKAASHLAEAENIYVVGYSFPPTDQFFKYFFAVGSVGEGWIDKIRVVDPDPNGDLEPRFKLLLGPLALSKFSVKKATFENVASNIVKELA